MSRAQVVAVAQELLAQQRAGAAHHCARAGDKQLQQAGSRGAADGTTGALAGMGSPTSGAGTVASRTPTLAVASPRGAVPAQHHHHPQTPGAAPPRTVPSSPAPQSRHAAQQQQQQHRQLSAAFGRPRRHQPTALLAAGGHDETWRSLKVVERYDPSSNTWAPGPAMAHSVSFAAGALLDRELVVVSCWSGWGGRVSGLSVGDADLAQPQCGSGTAEGCPAERAVARA